MHYCGGKGTTKTQLLQRVFLRMLTFFMPRTGRKHSGTGIYHVMLRGINRQGAFEDPEDHWEDGINNLLPVPMIPKEWYVPLVQKMLMLFR